MKTDDTIAALSSAAGEGARLIVRASGSQARDLARRLCPHARLDAPGAFLERMRLGEMEFPAWLYVFCSPHSYTGEDLVEFHIPGNALLARMVLDELYRMGARAAEAGEFTARAFFSGRIDLAEAEGVALTIAAQNEAELRAARQLLAGELARQLRPVIESLADLLARVEVGIDFSEEDVVTAPPDQIAAAIRQADRLLNDVLQKSARFDRLSHEVRAVLVGRPNVGKSTLLNALAGQERAVVSATAGTTRDVLYAPVALQRGIIRLADAAGLEDAPAGRIGELMRDHALREIEQADLLLLVREAGEEHPAPMLPRKPDLLVLTKLDLSPHFVPGEEGLAISALTGQNMELLRRRLDELAFGANSTGTELALSARHATAIDQARKALGRALAVVDQPELTALELREVLDALGSVLGQVTPDDLLGRIFAAFCIGK